MTLFYSILLVILISNNLYSDSNISKERELKERVESLKEPMYNPFIERYLVDEVKNLRVEINELKVKLESELPKAELRVSNKSIDYATSTINNMFYIIAAASSILVLIGWSSIKDMREKINNSVDEQISNLIKRNEIRMQTLEDSLEARSKQVIQNQKDIAETNTIHSLWLRAGLESTAQGKIDIYDEILKIRSDDAEVLSYKADAALELGEANWAFSLANQALNIDSNYPNAYYQRACAYSALGYPEKAIEDLEKTLELNEHYVDEILNEKELESLKDNESFKSLLEKLYPNEDNKNPIFV